MHATTKCSEFFSLQSETLQQVPACTEVKHDFPFILIVLQSRPSSAIIVSSQVVESDKASMEESDEQ